MKNKSENTKRKLNDYFEFKEENKKAVKKISGSKVAQIRKYNKMCNLS